MGTLIALFFEILGTSTGIPFGHYTYSPVMGYRIAGLVPFMVPLSWFYMVYASLAIVSRLFRADHTKGAQVCLGPYGGCAYDGVGYRPGSRDVHSHWALAWSTDDGGFFYGMPFTNWVGWFLTGSIVARAMLFGLRNYCFRPQSFTISDAACHLRCQRSHADRHMPSSRSVVGRQSWAQSRWEFHCFSRGARK